jgi:hypothetical protein
MMRWRNEDFNMAYVYARGYFDGRSNGVRETNLDWMTPEEVGIYSNGYDRGVTDYCELDEPEVTDQKAALEGYLTCNVSGDVSQCKKEAV